MMRRVLLLTTPLLVAVAWAPVSNATVKWFHSPSGNIACEVSVGRPNGTYALCTSDKPPQRAVLKANGHTSVCVRIRCLSNAPLKSFKLAYGTSIRLGPFRCTSRRDGVRCLVVRTGRGFLISRETIQVF
jgi:hypothetical protein